MHGRLCAVVLLLPCAGFGQLDRSSLNGTVTDPNGARVPGTQLTAIHSATGLTRKTETSSQGAYAFDGLAIGRYTIVFSKPGFAELRVEQVDQTIGQTRTLNVELQVSAVPQQSTVMEPLVHLDTASAAVGAPIDRCNCANCRSMAETGPA